MTTHISKAAVLVAALLVLSCSRKPQVVQAPPEVLVMEVAARDVPITSSWLGTLDGSANVEIKARVQGYLTKCSYSAGTLVKEGDVLFEIDDKPFATALDQARANLSKAEALQQKTALEAQRQQNLFAQKAASERDRDVAVKNNEAAQAEVNAAKAAVESAEINLGYTKVKSPIYGIAGIATPGVGDLIGPNGPVLTTVSAVDPIKATFQISEKEYYAGAERLTAMLAKPLDARPREVSLTLADGSVYPGKGVISAADRQINLKTGTLQVEALFPNEFNKLRPGFFVRVSGVVKMVWEGLVVPQQAVIQMQGITQLAVVGEDNKVEIRTVKATHRIGSEWLIEEGIHAGERVVVAGLQKVRSGMTVVAKPWSAPIQK